MSLVAFVCVILIASTDAFVIDTLRLRCASCTNITNIHECHNYTTCNQGERCSASSYGIGDETRFDLGCKTESECLSTSAPSFVGRSVSPVKCLQCCTVDNCNEGLCSAGTQGSTSGQQTDSVTCDNVQDIAIVGAGIAGSYAAWRMRNEGLSVSLYEYSDRIGGRCHTVQFPGIPDVNVEMGAMRFIPLEHTLLNKTVHALGLNVVDFKLGWGSASDSLYYLRGKHLRHDEIAANAPYDILPDHRIDPDTLQWQMFKNYTDVDSSVDGYASEPKMLFQKTKDGIPLYRQSRKSFYAKYFTTDTERYIQDIGAFDSEFENVVAAGFITWRDPALRTDSTPNPVKTIASGFQSIPETLVDHFLKASTTHSLHRNLHLRSVMKNKDGNYVLTFQPTQTVRGETKDNLNLTTTHVCAKKVLLAIPRAALEKLDWDALKRADIMDYMQNSIVEAQAGKMFFAYGDTWWKNIPLASPYAISTTPLRQTYDYAASSSTGKGVLLAAYTDFYTEVWKDSRFQGNFVPGVGDDTLAMTNIGVDIARKMYAEIFNISVSDVQQPDYAIMSIWDKYPFGASWYWWRPGYIWEDVENKMTRPSLDDDVFIISNTFSKTMMQGWTEGALEIVENTLAKYFPGV